jgi:uncharacterized tellurite resistance protein B-like protein
MISFKSVGHFIEDLLDRQTGNDELEDHDLRLASAALLAHTVTVDGEAKESETAVLRQLLTERFDLSPEELRELITAAERKEREAIDLYGFTSVIKSRTSLDERLKIIEMMWRLVFADGEVDAFEDNLVWRAAELLGVETRDRMALKKRVLGEQ